MARKQLNADVKAFLRGDQADTKDEQVATSKKKEEPPIESQPATMQNKGNGGMLTELLGTEPQGEALVRYTADLPESLHQRLSYAAITSRTTKIKLLRQILDKVLPELPT
jgi:hypothetical protein